MHKYINPAIRKALISFAVVLVTMIVVVSVSDMYKWNAGDEDTRAKREMRKWRNKIDEANRNNQILVDHEDKFKVLQKNAVIGNENRLSWVEVVQKTAESRNMSSVKYDITSQLLQDKKELGDKYAGIDVFKSVMSIDMRFMHEGDLFVMMNALKKEAKGLFTIDKCDIELVNKTNNFEIDKQNAAENMRAYCELSWYTLKKAVSS